jgi:hypothetical protein
MISAYNVLLYGRRPDNFVADIASEFHAYWQGTSVIYWNTKPPWRIRQLFLILSRIAYRVKYVFQLGVACQFLQKASDYLHSCLFCSAITPVLHIHYVVVNERADVQRTYVGDPLNRVSVVLSSSIAYRFC